jgi:hypothetical protein
MNGVACQKSVSEMLVFFSHFPMGIIRKGDLKLVKSSSVISRQKSA